MHVELTDLVRCTREHEESWLVAAAMRTSNREIVAGVLGCPVCGAEYFIREGIADFRDEPRAQYDTTRDTEAHDDAMIMAAMLDLTEPDRTIALVGFDGQLAAELQEITPVRVVVCNPPNGVAAQGTYPVATLLTGNRLPIAPRSLHGIAVRDSDLPTNVVELLRPGGRLVASASTPVPDGINELARDDRSWVGAREAIPSPVIQLRRQPSE